MTVHGAGVCWAPRFDGVGVLLKTVYLFPITVIALVGVVGALGFRAARRRGYGPLLLGLFVASLLLVGKFVLEFDPVTFGGIGLLIIASVWNSWPNMSVKNKPIQFAVPKNDSTNH